MLTIDSPNNILYKEFFEDYQKAIYWFKKQYHGEKGYEKMRDKLLHKTFFSKETQISDIVEYKSPNGNRWRIFECSRYFNASNGAHTNIYAFVYYETMASCGAFMPIFSPSENGLIDEDSGVQVFTDHFFYRMCSRLEIPYRSSTMIQRFLEMIPLLVVQKTNEYYGDKLRVNVALPGSQGRGVLESYGTHPILKVKTFYLNTELTSKQRKETEDLRRAQKVNTYEPPEMREARIKKIGYGAFLKEEINRLTAMGYPEPVAEGYYNLGYMINASLYDCGYKELCTTDTTVKISDNIMASSIRIHSKPFDVNAFLEFMLLIQDISERKNSSIDIDKIGNYALKEYWKQDHSVTDIRKMFVEYKKKIEGYEKGRVDNS